MVRHKVRLRRAQAAEDALLLADPDLQASLDQMRRGEVSQALTAAEEACLGETSPPTCNCPCYGCKHHCAAHREE